jgi:predicted nucleic acid-binding protein
MDLIADTSYLIGLWRGQPWATSYASVNSSKSLGIPWIVLGEFWHGSVRAGHDAKTVSEFLAVGLAILDPIPVIPAYAQICAKLQSEPVYKLIGQNDLWIAAVAVAHSKPLLSRNKRHFESIPNLRLEVLQP